MKTFYIFLMVLMNASLAFGAAKSPLFKRDLDAEYLNLRTALEIPEEVSEMQLAKRVDLKEKFWEHKKEIGLSDDAIIAHLWSICALNPAVRKPKLGYGEVVREKDLEGEREIKESGERSAENREGQEEVKLAREQVVVEDEDVEDYIDDLDYKALVDFNSDKGVHGDTTAWLNTYGQRLLEDEDAESKKILCYLIQHAKNMDEEILSYWRLLAGRWMDPEMQGNVANNVQQGQELELPDESLGAVPQPEEASQPEEEGLQRDIQELEGQIEAQQASLEDGNNDRDVSVLAMAAIGGVVLGCGAIMYSLVNYVPEQWQKIKKKWWGSRDAKDNEKNRNRMVNKKSA